MNAATSTASQRDAPRVRGPLLESGDEAMGRVLRLAEGVAATPATVLLTGESGTGKEVLARWIHAMSPRSGQPFVAVNCGAMPANLIESELFGHERGAFSGATERRVGRFESADGGTLLLDEISEMPLELQTRLLRVLQEREVHRVGGSAPIRVDVRVVATSNQDLRRLVRDGRFREDLYYRINVFPIHVPPLRERMQDLAPLCEAILSRVSCRFGRRVPRLTSDALARLSRWRWPGNVRELSNVLERALILAPGDVIEGEHVLLDPDVPSSEDGGGAAPGSSTSLGGANLADLEQETILRVLEACGGNRTHAAEQLGISVRTLRNRLREYRDQGVAVPRPGSGVPAARSGARGRRLDEVGTPWRRSCDAVDLG
ncbi:MAG: sigma-54 interaction domain-containing protein [Myxococcota bacterium]